MVVGECLYVNNGTATVLSPWFEKCGDAATFGAEILAFGPTPGGVATGTLEIRVQTKTFEQSDQNVTTLDRQDAVGSWTPIVAGGGVSTGAFVSTARYRDFMDLVRFRYIIQSAPVKMTFWVQLRMVPPMWESNILCCPLERRLSADSEVSF